MRSRIILALPIAALLVLGCATSKRSEAHRSLNSQPSIEVQGHRGARAVLPENSLPAMQHALEVGVDVLEMDLGVTRDNVLVLAHERRVPSSLCRRPGRRSPLIGPRIRSLTLEQIKAYDCGSIANSRFPKQATRPGTPMPTLDEVFELVKNSPLAAASRVGFNIETKISPSLIFRKDTVPPKQFARLVVEALRKHGMLERTTLQSFDFRTLVEARKLEPGIRISALVEDPSVDLLLVARELKPEVISPHYELLTPEKVTALKALGARVIPWTVNQPADWDRLIAMRVDGLITDDPEALLQHLGRLQRPQVSSEER